MGGEAGAIPLQVASVVPSPCRTRPGARARPSGLVSGRLSARTLSPVGGPFAGDRPLRSRDCGLPPEIQRRCHGAIVALREPSSTCPNGRSGFTISGAGCVGEEAAILSPGSHLFFGIRAVTAALLSLATGKSPVHLFRAGMRPQFSLRSAKDLKANDLSLQPTGTSAGLEFQ